MNLDTYDRFAAYCDNWRKCLSLFLSIVWRPFHHRLNTISIADAWWISSVVVYELMPDWRKAGRASH
jgi:hypothetical protein